MNSLPREVVGYPLVAMTTDDEWLLEEHAWPNVPRTVFGPGEPLAHGRDADVDWLLLSGAQGMVGYVEGYARAARATFELFSNGGQSPEYLLWPLAFLWRHHLEIAMKDIIARGREIDGEEWGHPAHHNLNKLWEEAKAHVAKCGPDESPEMDNVAACLAEFQKVDPGADGFRYPTAKGPVGRSLPSAPGYISLVLFQEAMEALSNFFSGVQAAQQVMLDHLQSAASNLG